jgi:hypothetical protein
LKRTKGYFTDTTEDDRIQQMTGYVRSLPCRNGPGRIGPGMTWFGRYKKIAAEAVFK